MPVPRGHRDTRAVAPAAARTLTETEAQRLRRRNGAYGKPGVPRLIWAQTRNGLPFKPYTYRGDGPFASEEWG